MNRPRVAGLVVVAGAALMFATVAVVAAHALSDASVNACNSPDGFAPWVGWVIVLASIGSFLVGQFVGSRPEKASPRPKRPAPALVTAGRWAKHHRSTRLVMALIRAAVFAIGAVILVYETAGLQNVYGFEPITSYVRCAKAQWPAPTALVSCAMCFVVGSWLVWYERGKTA